MMRIQYTTSRQMIRRDMNKTATRHEDTICRDIACDVAAAFAAAAAIFAVVMLLQEDSATPAACRYI